MAIEQKIPSPSEITGEVKKFTPQEIQEIQSLKSQINSITYQFGQLSLGKLKLKEQEAFLNSNLKNLEEEEIKLAKNLSDKYGKGSLDIETGEFTPIE